MLKKIKELRVKAQEQIEQTTNPDQLKEIRQEYLGRKKGKLTQLLRGLKDLSPTEKPKAGALANQAKNEIENLINQKLQECSLAQEKNQETFIDFTLPGKQINYGHLHPLTQVKNELSDIFYSMGYQILEGPEIETDYYNFEALNIPPGHPARDMWDTFYLKSKKRELLKTHTSPMQVRVMEKQTPPLKVCVFGRCFRHEATDASHEHTLHQMEGFVVDKNINVANLIDTLKVFLQSLFGTKIKIRLRPSYFPFTEPSFEVDFACLNCQGKGCPVCNQTGWVEILGAGMIHPQVFKSVGYPAGKYTGFAFGLGLDRLTLMRYQIDDIRWFHSGDLRFIRQF
jgi:phenylalanyl-tRNA synthetase alpha chain